ncbi:hypothetical protein, partial [Marinovum algicola]|uniref:hypothetical protein n=1 Tax=Marinovum algicola TaxID=42444 RepID=UPI0024BBB85F
MRKAKWTVASFAAMIMLMVFCPTARARAEAAWTILFNGTASKTEVIETDSGPMVPVYFPVPKEGESDSYGVLIETDVAT